MRDDIHRRLPIPKTWKGFVRTCTRDAERESWVERARHTAAMELRGLTGELLRAARRDAMQPTFFAGVSTTLAALARTPLDHAFIRALAATTQVDRGAALQIALNWALTSVMEAGLREVRVHASIDSPRDCARLLNRMRDAIDAAGIPQLVTERLSGQALPTLRRRPLDLDEDLRGAP